MSTKHSGGRDSIRSVRREPSTRRARRLPGDQGTPHWDRAPGRERCATTRPPTGAAAACKTAFASTAAKAALSALRDTDRQDPHRRARHVVLPELPASGREPLGQTAVAVEAPELGVAADRIPSMTICGTVQPPVRSNSFCRNAGSASSDTSSSSIPRVLEQRLRPHAIAAPACAVHPHSRHQCVQTRKPPRGSSYADTRLARPWPDAGTRRRRSSCARSGSAKRTGCCTCTRSHVGASAPSRRGSARRSRASAPGWSRSGTSN